MRQSGRGNNLAFARFVIIVSFSLFASSLYAAEPFAVPAGARCDECGMPLDQNSKFLSIVITQDTRKLYFCDIGDMISHFRSTKDAIRSVFVRDYMTGEWIDGKNAFYSMNKTLKTPMGWGIAAFSKESDSKKLGPPVTFQNVFGLIKR
jgi:nitrous oxide reductase accessory protein NosL